MPTIPETIDLIRKLHAGQVDKAGVPYWNHPYNVMRRLPEGVSDDVKHAALLHDVLEDTELTNPEDLDNLGYSTETREIVLLLTRSDCCTRKQYEDRLAQSSNLDAILVKACDLADNLALNRRAGLSRMPEFVERYLALELRLLGALPKSLRDYIDHSDLPLDNEERNHD